MTSNHANARKTRTCALLVLCGELLVRGPFYKAGGGIRRARRRRRVHAPWSGRGLLRSCAMLRYANPQSELRFRQ